MIRRVFAHFRRARSTELIVLGAISVEKGANDLFARCVRQIGIGELRHESPLSLDVEDALGDSRVSATFP